MRLAVILLHRVCLKGVVIVERVDVFISSTSQDLSIHRKEAADACLRMGMFPIAMEQLPASNSNALSISLKMCDDAEIYLGIFGHRYGYIPPGYDISITEAEYNRAVENGIPRLVFVMHDDHPIKVADIEKGFGAVKLQNFKDRLLSNNIVNFFKSPEDLRGQVIHSLAPHRREQVIDLHPRYASDVPIPPQPYTPHPYTLLQTQDLIGRQQELDRITEWAVNSDSTVFNFVVAIGGMGKSALTWKWFNDIAPEVMPNLAGRMWWSFYESDASFENFVLRSLIYVSGESKDKILTLSHHDRELELLGILNQNPFLFVLDGLERVMIAYARFSANSLEDDLLDETTANYIGLIASEDKNYERKIQLRKTIDPRIGYFLRKLANLKMSRFLVSSRLYPSDLQTITGVPRVGCESFFLTGLSDDDALALWYGLGGNGTKDSLLSTFQAFDNYPLLIRALAGEVCSFKRSPCGFEEWKNANPEFNAYLNLPFTQIKTHVFRHAMQGLGEREVHVLQLVASIRSPMPYQGIAHILIEEEAVFPSEKELDTCLELLEDRGLLGWDRKSNRYDLHPIIRGIIWNHLNPHRKAQVYRALEKYLKYQNRKARGKVETVDDVLMPIERFYAMVGQERYAEAWQFFRTDLAKIIFYKLNAIQQQIEMLERLFPDGIDSPPAVKKPDQQSHICHTLALAYDLSGQGSKAIDLYKRSARIDEGLGNHKDQAITMRSLVDALFWSGRFREAELLGIETLKINIRMADRYSQAATLRYWGLPFAARGFVNEATKTLGKSIDIFMALQQSEPGGLSEAYFAMHCYWIGDYERCLAAANRSFRLVEKSEVRRDVIRAKRLQGFAQYGLGNLEAAQELLVNSLETARKVNFIHEEIYSLLGLARINLALEEYEPALEKLDGIWELAERGPYPLFLADAYNILGRVSQAIGDIQRAIDAAKKAYSAAWCDGQLYSYHWGLKLASEILDELGEEPPNVPYFDQIQPADMVKLDIDSLL